MVSPSEKIPIGRERSLVQVTDMSNTFEYVIGEACNGSNGTRGVIIKDFSFVSSSEPQAANEYPVEPAGVAMMRPSHVMFDI